MSPNASKVIALFQALEPDEQFEVVSHFAQSSGLIQKGMNVGPGPLRRRIEEELGVNVGPFPGVGKPQSGVNIGPAPITNRARGRVCPTCNRPV